MKKNTTKILMAALALFMAIGIATGTTFAWFALNNTVEATGMQIQAKSNETFLLIMETASATGANDAAKAATIQGASNPTSATLTVSESASAVYPSKPYEGGSEATKYPTVAASATEVTDYDTAAVPGNWFTANSLDPATSDTTVTNDKVLTVAGGSAATDFDKYVIKKSVTLTVAKGADNAHELTVTGKILPNGLSTETATGTAEAGKTYYSYSAGVYTKETVTAGVTPVTGFYYKDTEAGDPAKMDLTAVKVLVVADNDNHTTLTYAQNGTPQDLYVTSTSDETITDATIIIVDIYIYYDGSAAIVTSNKKAELGWATIDLTFGVTVGNGTADVNSTPVTP